MQDVTETTILSELKSQFKFGKSFCPMPFLHLHVDTNKKQKLCCESKYIDNDIDQFNSKLLFNIREKMLNNEKISECDSCYRVEKKERISYRQQNIKDLLPHYKLLFDQIEKHKTNDEINPLWYDLRISNNCNLACQTCNSKSSSTIAKENNIENPHLSYEPDLYINPDTIKIYMAGGEPFLIKKFVSFLEKIKNKNCEIVVNTNATILTKTFLNELTKFNTVSFTVSVDGYGIVNEKIRKHSVWNNIEKNIDTLISMGFRVDINTVVQKDNINFLCELADYISSKDIKRWTLTELSGVEDHSLKNAEIDKIYIEKLLTYDIVKNNIESVNYLKYIIQEYT